MKAFGILFIILALALGAFALLDVLAPNPSFLIVASAIGISGILLVAAGDLRDKLDLMHGTLSAISVRLAPQQTAPPPLPDPPLETEPQARPEWVEEQPPGIPSTECQTETPAESFAIDEASPVVEQLESDGRQ